MNIANADEERAGISPATGTPSGQAGARAFLTLMCLAACLFMPVRTFADSMKGEKAHASWYGTTAHGKVTANGETFDRYNLTVAHKKLPFGLVLRVKNLNNGRQVLVRVNDRGPYIPGRSLDVSRRAAIALNMLDSGVAPVSYEIISDKKGRPLNKDNAFYVHLANVRDPSKAKEHAEKLGAKYQCRVVVLPAVKGTSPTHALCIGPFKSFRNAQKEFLRCEKQVAALGGIIEAPAKPAEILPRAAATKKNNDVKTVKAELSATGAAMPDFGQAALQALCSPSLHKGFGMLDTALGTFFGIHGNQPALSIHYSVLSQCPDLSL